MSGCSQLSKSATGLLGSARRHLARCQIFPLDQKANVCASVTGKEIPNVVSMKCNLHQQCWWTCAARPNKRSVVNSGSEVREHRRKKHKQCVFEDLIDCGFEMEMSTSPEQTACDRNVPDNNILWTEGWFKDELQRVCHLTQLSGNSNTCVVAQCSFKNNKKECHEQPDGEEIQLQLKNMWRTGKKEIASFFLLGQTKGRNEWRRKHLSFKM